MNIIIQFFKQIIEWIYGFFGDYGVAIVLITMAIRILLMPLNMKQRKQSLKTQSISREAESIKKTYGSDQQKMKEELQKLYQKNGAGAGSCLLGLVQLPIMLCLYHAIRLTVAAGTATVLLPWVSSLLVRDQTLLLPAVTLLIQLVPQTYPYISFFQSLKQQKPSVGMMLILLVSNGLFAFMIPSGVELYYLVSGAFSALEQLMLNLYMVRKMSKTVV